MNAIRWRNVLYIILGISAVTSICTWYAEGQFFSIEFVLACMGNSSTVIGVVSSIFAFKLWKCKFFKGWLVIVPNLNGVWKGTIKSNWINPETNQKMPPIEATLSIKQSLFNINCVVKTQESESRSTIANFVIIPENQIEKLVYVYQNDSSLEFRKKSPIHNGTASLNIIRQNESVTLIGNYWTDRETTGVMEFNKVSEKDVP